MQELVSFISIMLGVIVLTAWVMWILFRPSGDNKVEEFATKSAKDGMTLAVIENNELKNKITRLEREIKVLMSVGYPGKSEQHGLEQEERGKDEEKAKGETLKVKDEGLRTKEEGEKVKGEGSKEERKDEEESRKAQESILKIKELESQLQENEAKVKAEAAAKAVEASPSPKVVPLSEAQRITDEAEKKKISDYLASVEETAERQKKEVEALDEKVALMKEPKQHPDDDLKKIKGIGPHLESKLKNAGISSYLQIAGFNEAEIQHVSKVIGSYPRRIRREAWVEQAKVLVNKG